MTLLRRLTAAAAVLALLAGGCGNGDSRRDEVARYIDRVNAVQARLSAPLVAVSRANRDFGKKSADRAELVRRLRRSAARIDALRRELAALPAPAEARRLRALLLELAGREAALTREVAALAAFLPAFQAALRPLGAAGAELREALGEQGSPAAKAAALETYAGRIGGVLERLRGLRPPTVTGPLYRSQVATLGRVREASAALAAALRANRGTEVPELLRQLNEAAVSNQSLAAQRAQIAAVRAYNQRIRGLSLLTARVAREHARLEQALE